ncbi:MAG: transcriptional repressor [Crocinitomicaceae bacterium]
MENLLKSKNLRVTPFRMEVLSVFQKFDNAIDSAVLESELGDFDRITLYRTIKSFIDAGVLHEILISGESKKYALCAETCVSEDHSHEHIHFLCTVCNETFCLEPTKMPELQHSSFQIASFEIQAKGVCEACIS